ANLGDVEDQLDRLERDVRELQLEVYKGGPPPADSGAYTAGPSAGAGQGGARLNDVEQSLRDLRGQVETLTFQVRQLTEQLELARKEAHYRLGALEGGAPAGAMTTPMASAPPLSAGVSPTPKPLGPAGGPASAPPPGMKSGTLGTLPSSAVPAAAAGGLSP